MDNFDGLLAIYGLEGTKVAQVNPNWVDTLIWFLNLGGVGVALVVVGLLALYIEVKLPGIGFAGITSALCFLIFFWSRVMGGTAGTLEILLFLAGVLCVAIEILVIPGFGVLA